MTPKEKAEELVNKYLMVLPSRNPIMYIGDIETAQKCALISVDERIDEMYDWMGGGGYEWEKNRFQYWEQVKNEIKKL